MGHIGGSSDWYRSRGGVGRDQCQPPSGGTVVPPTLADVAGRAGVSRQTVSNAINNPDLLRPETLARVQDAIRRSATGPTAPHATSAPARRR